MNGTVREDNFRAEADAATIVARRTQARPGVIAWASKSALA